MAAPILFVTGTDTGVGKTTVSALLLSALCQAGYKVAAIKPIETGCERMPDGRLQAKDAEILSRAIGKQCPVVYRFENGVAPQVAAQLEQSTIDVDAIKKAVNALAAENQLLLVEGAGGFLVPIAPGYTYRELAADISASSIVVVGSRLGAINHATLTFESLRAARAPCIGYVLNQLSALGEDIALRTNGASIRELAARLGMKELCSLPYLDSSSIQPEIDVSAADRSIQQLMLGVIEYFRLSL